MKTSTLALGLFASLAAAADRPANTSICDYYTTALLKDNTAENQGKVLTLLVNTVVLGSAMPKPNITGVTFPTVQGLNGILDPNATYMGQGANLLPYFDGGLASSNRGDGKSGVAVNFLDDGGAEPLMAGKAANGMNSKQYMLLTHLYQFFGTLLNCTQQGMSNDFMKYQGVASMYKVHQFMALNSSQVNYFISQVGLAAQSFGVSDDDVTAVGKALSSVFGVRCAAPYKVTPDSDAVLESICITSDCPQAPGGDCSKYSAVMQPAVANMSLAMGEGNASATAGTMMATGTMAGGSMMATGTSGAMASGSGTAGASAGAAPTNYAGALAAGGLAAVAFFL